jgi:hypothetical protein
MRTSPWITVLLAAAAGYTAAGVLDRRRRKVRGNPLPRDPADAYTAFHWGRKPDRVRRVNVPPTPRQLVELGELASVTYATRKGSEDADYMHDFGRSGRGRPRLAYDPRSRRLHIIGGAYTVEDRGIVG